MHFMSVFKAFHFIFLLCQNRFTLNYNIHIKARRQFNQEDYVCVTHHSHFTSYPADYGCLL